MVLLYHFWQYRAYFSVRYCPIFDPLSKADALRRLSKKADAFSAKGDPLRLRLGP